MEMGCLKTSGREHYAVSEVLSLVMVLLIVASAISAILLWAVPYMNEKMAENRSISALNQFNVINDIIKGDVIAQGYNSTSVVEFTIDAGKVSLNSSGERFIFYYSMLDDFDFNVVGLNDNNKEFTIIIENDPSGLADFIDVYYLLDYYPPDLDIGWADPFTVSYPLVNAIQIDICDTGLSTVGRIFLFDTGSITYETFGSSVSYSVITENGGVVSGKDVNGYLYDKPNFKIDGNRLMMRVIQFKPGSVTSAGGTGQGKYSFTISLDENYIRETNMQIFDFFRLQIYGNEVAVTAWENYFKIYHGFDQYDSGNAEGTLYLSFGDRFVTLTNSVCDVYLRM